MITHAMMGGKTQDRFALPAENGGYGHCALLMAHVAATCQTKEDNTHPSQVLSASVSEMVDDTAADHP